MKQYEEILDNKGLKKTEIRILLLDFLSKIKKPISASEVLLQLKKNKLDQVTVYRTLESFLEKGIIKKVETGKRESEYEIIDEKNDHHHMICMKCNRIEDFIGCDSLKIVESALKKSKNFKKISHHSFDLFGLCNNCEENKK